MIITVSVKIWSDWVPIKFRKSKTPMDLLPEGKAPAAARPLPRIALLRCRRFRTFSRELVRSVAAADAGQSPRRAAIVAANWRGCDVAFGPHGSPAKTAACTLERIMVSPQCKHLVRPLIQGRALGHCLASARNFWVSRPHRFEQAIEWADRALHDQPRLMTAGKTYELIKYGDLQIVRIAGRQYVVRASHERLITPAAE